MDNFSNTSGYASLVRKHFPNLNLKIFGGLIMEPPAGGVSYKNAKISLEYSYFENDGAKFISFPTHHTRYIAIQEKRILFNQWSLVERNIVGHKTKKYIDALNYIDTALAQCPDKVEDPYFLHLCGFINYNIYKEIDGQSA